MSINQSIDLQKMSKDVFLCDRDLRHEGVKERYVTFVSMTKALFVLC